MYGTTPCDCNVSLRSPRDNVLVLIGGIDAPLTMLNSESLNVLNKRQSTSPSVTRNTQKFDAYVDGNLDDDRDSTSILRKVLG